MSFDLDISIKQAIVFIRIFLTVLSLSLSSSNIFSGELQDNTHNRKRSDDPIQDHYATILTQPMWKSSEADLPSTA